MIFFKRNITSAFLLISAFFFTSIKAEAECISSDIFNYTIDFPEMFEIQDCTEDERSILFKHKLLAVQAVIRIWDEASYKNSQEALKDTLKKLSAEGEVSAVKWRNANCAVSKLSISEKALGEKMSGWGVSIPLPKTKDWFTMLSFASADKAFDCEQFILSLLDSIMIDRGSRTGPGLITTFAFPQSQEKKITLNIAGKKIQTKIDKDAAEANQFVVDREFAVFSLFVNQDCWKEAWQRFYRMIAKDAMGRVKTAAFDISSALSELSQKNDSENPDAALAQLLLTWVQGFNYERPSTTPDRADFTNIPDTLTGKGSDCDSRSMLLMVLYKNLGMDAVMFISVDYSHAMAGICLEGKQGQTFTLDSKDYLFGETTAKDITFGMLPADMQDRSKWIPVELYN